MKPYLIAVYPAATIRDHVQRHPSRRDFICYQDTAPLAGTYGRLNAAAPAITWADDPDSATLAAETLAANHPGCKVVIAEVSSVTQLPPQDPATMKFNTSKISKKGMLPA
jgi:hypothetical protein